MAAPTTSTTTTATEPFRPEALGAGLGSVALACDYLIFLRGAERTFEAIAECFPEATIYTAAYVERDTERRFAGRRIETSYLQRLRVSRRWFRALLPLYPRAIEALPVRGHDLVVSSSFGFAHGVLAGDATHVCYCHTPFRYAWQQRPQALAATPRLARPAVGALLDRIRSWDLEAARRVTAYVANAELTRERIAACYERDATVVHPPVDIERFIVEGAARGPHFLTVGELVSHKRTEIALEAARSARVPIKVVGGGPELRRLARRYGSSAEFLGRVSDAELPAIYAGARALVLPNVEEFGIVAVEAQAAGIPVLALDGGGARETVVDGRTGVLVGASASELADAMRSVDFDRFEPADCRASAARFSRRRFQERFVAELRRVVAERNGVAAGA